MAAKPDLTRVWAAGAPGGNIEDPDDTTPGKFNAGWVAEIPPFENFNFLQQLFSQGLANLNEQGIFVYDVVTDYPVNAITKASDGLTYKCLQPNGPATTLKDPAAEANPLFWERWGFSSSELATGLVSFKNKIINGAFNVNQREVSGSVVLSAGEYGHDRWKAGAGGCTYTFATSLNVATITISAGSLVQVVEGNNLQSGTHILSSAGTAVGTIDGGTTTETLVGGTNATIEFGTGTLSNVQLEKRSAITTFEQRPLSVEETLCYRYYYENKTVKTGWLITTTNTRKYASWEFPANMRVIPVLTYTVSSGTPATTDVTTKGATINSLVASVGTQLTVSDFTADAEL